MRIAVVAATNPGYTNPGMLTVDLAAAGVLQRAVPDGVISWYALHAPDQFGEIHASVNPSELPFRWLSLVDHFDDVCGHDVILLWGDFLQARHYFVEDAVDRLVEGSNNSLSAESALDVLYRCLLFKDAAPTVLNKVFIFGSSILFNRQTDYCLDRYGEYLFRLFRNCGGAWAREPMSASKIQHLRQDYASTALGTDSAFLLRDEDFAHLSTTRWLDDAPFDDRIGLFFGTRTRPSRALFGFLRELTRRLDLQVEWLPWFPLHEWMRSASVNPWRKPLLAAALAYGRRKIDRLMTRRTSYSAGDLLAAVGRYRFIVTDTYHLCVNSWRAGTPAVCFGSPEGTPKHQTLNDYKKRVLYEMYEASDFYFSTSSIHSSAGRRAVLEKVAHVIGDDSIAAAITQRIHAHARSVEQALTEAISARGKR